MSTAVHAILVMVEVNSGEVTVLVITGNATMELIFKNITTVCPFCCWLTNIFTGNESLKQSPWTRRPPLTGF